MSLFVKKNETFKELNQEMSFNEYLELVKCNPNLLRNSYQRMADMIESYGFEMRKDPFGEHKHYNFFDDPFNNGADAVFGIEDSLVKIVDFFKNASLGLGAEKRILLLHGPVGSAKSSIARLLKRGLEYYSKTNEGLLFTYYWVDDEKSDVLGGDSFLKSPMNEEPLKLLDLDMRKEFILSLKNTTKYKNLMVKGELSPCCKFILNKYLDKYNGDLEKVLDKHIRVKRLVLSEKERIGIGTFQPKDEKNQDSTELTGDINYRKISKYGSDSDPRAFNFDGEFNVANRGMIEFIEMLKLDVAFLYDLLGASQEQSIKPKKFAQTDIDEVIIGHTNEPEFRKLQSNEFMEALRDRTVKIDIPYILKLDDEVKIYEKTFNKKVIDLHMSPHAIKIASIWSILTRLEEPSKSDLSKINKLYLYNGKSFSGYNKDSVLELKKEAKREGLHGISPRYIQDKISNSIIQSQEEGCLSPFKLMQELENGLKHHGLISSEEQMSEFLEALNDAKMELDRFIQEDIRSAISLEEEAIKTLCSNYVDNIKAYCQREKIRNKYSNRLEDPDEKFMRSIEDKIDIPESRKDDFRREILNFIGALAIENKMFKFDTNERLYRALQSKLFEDQKDQIKLNTTVGNIVDKKTQEKIEVIKTRLIEKYHYCDKCANDALSYGASLFSKGGE